MDDNCHKGRVALVTGGARGIGRVIAETLAGKGAKVAILDIAEDRLERTVEELRSDGHQVLGVKADVRSEKQVGEGIRKIKSQFGAVDILVNNAAVVDVKDPIRRLTREDWDRVISVNLTGCFVCIKACLEDMIAQSWGRIINISSDIACFGAKGNAAYAASKSGMAGLTKTVALEHATDGVTCNILYPGLIATEEQSNRISSSKLEALKREIPTKESGSPLDVANAVSFLASEETRYINGSELHVDAGMRLLTEDD